MAFVSDKPAVAMTYDGKIIKRWERSGDSHWIIGSTMQIDGVVYRLIEIRETAGCDYLMARRAQ